MIFIAFAIGLFLVCTFYFSLYTGKVGMIVYNHAKSDWISLFGCLLGNLTGTLCCALAVWVGVPSLKENALTLVEKTLAVADDHGSAAPGEVRGEDGGDFDVLEGRAAGHELAREGDGVFLEVDGVVVGFGPVDQLIAQIFGHSGMLARTSCR